MKYFFKNLEEIICVVLLAGIVCLTVAQVFSRFVMNSPIGWTEELARILMIWMVFFGSSAAVKRNEHIKIEVFLNRLSDKWRNYLGKITGVIVGVLLIVLIYQGTLLTFKMASIPTVTLPISWSFVYSAVPIGCAFILFRMIQYRSQSKGG